MTSKWNIGILKALLKVQTSALFLVQISLGAVIFICLLIAILRYQNTVFSTVEPKNSGKNMANSSDESFPKEVKPLSFYTDLTGARDIFHFGTAQTSITAVATGTTTTAGTDFATRYIVQGIILDKNPQAIIRDSQGGKAYFVHRNEKLDGATLEDIVGNRVIFNLAGETLELIKK